MNENEKSIVVLRLNRLIKYKSRINPVGFKEFLDSWKDFLSNYGNIRSVITLISIVDTSELDTILDIIQELEEL